MRSSLASHPLRREDVCDQYRPLVDGLIRRMHVPAAMRDDARLEGAAALLRAFDQYDPTSPVHFSVFARLYVRGAISRRVYTAAQIAELPHDDPLAMKPLARELADAEDEMALIADVRRWVASLCDEDGWIIYRFYWTDADAAQVAEELGVTPRRVNQRRRALLSAGAEVLAA
jgi:RNA polymerase sigma factor (sigma-70 family)